MNKRLKRSVGTLFLLAAALFLWLFVSRTTTDAIRQELEQMTGARVELESAERLWFGPGFRLHRVSFEGDAWRLQADYLEVRFAYWSLLMAAARPSALELSDARLTLGGEGGTATALKSLPLDASWSVSRLMVLGPVGGETRELLYVEQARLEWLSTGGARAMLVGGPELLHPSTLRLQGEVNNLSATAFPDGKLQVEFSDFPAQPLVGFLTGELAALRTARLAGAASVASTPQQGTATGHLNALTPAHQLLEAEFKLAATPERLQLESARGILAGNTFEASGAVERWLTKERQADISLQLPQAELRADTLDILHEALGRKALGFAENLRGGFSAELRFQPAADRTPVTGEIELEGMHYTPDGLPPMENLRGHLRLEGTRIVFGKVTGLLLETPSRLSGEIRGTQVALRLATDGIPLANLPWVADAGLPIKNLTGQVVVDAAIGGEALAPTVNGTAHLAGAGFDFQGVEIRDTEGEIEFDLAGARAGELRGRVGECTFTAAAAAPFANWRDSASATARVPACEIGALARLAERAGALQPGLIEANALSGQGSIALELDGAQWRGGVTAAGVSWSPEWLPQPFANGELRAQFSPDGVALQHARAQFGASTFTATGRFPLAAAVGGPWQVEIESHLAAADVVALLREGWRSWFVLPGPLDGYASLTGRDAGGVAVEASLQSTHKEVEVAGVLASVPKMIPHRLDLQGTIVGENFALKLLAAHVGEAALHATGQVPLGRDGEFDLRLTAPSATPLHDVLSLVRVPEAVGPVEGAVAVDLHLRGTWESPELSGGVVVEGARLPLLLTEPVELRGRIGVSQNGFQLDGFEVVQPHGSFAISGQLRREGKSELELAGAWADLDRLVGQLPGGHWSHPEGEFWVRHPVRVGIAIEEVKFLGAVFSDVRGELRQEEGRLQLYVPDFAFGKGKGDLFAETYPERHELLVRLGLDQISTEQFLSDVLKIEPAVSGSLRLDAELTGPLGGKDEFVRGASGRLDFKIPQGRLQRGTLPERLFAVAVLLNEGLYGFGLNRLARIFNPTGLRRFRDWSGTVELEGGKARIVESTLSARVYDVTLTGEIDVPTGAFQVHGDGSFHPGWEFDISLRAIVNVFARAFQLARGKRSTPFEFDIAGDIRGSKRVQNFRFK